MQDQEKESRTALGQSPVSLCMDTHSNIFELILQTLKHLPGEGNGNPLQYSCLEYPVDRGACWAAVYGVTQSWTELKRLSSSSSSSGNPFQVGEAKD